MGIRYMKDFLFNFMSQHKERFISVGLGIGTLAVGYLVGVPTPISALASFGMACLPEAKKAVSALSASVPVLTHAIDAHLMKRPKLQIALLLSGEAIGHLYGVPLPLLAVAPFIIAPTLLQTIKNYAYLAVPFGIMALQINKAPAQYLTSNLFSFAAIGGLFLGKKHLSTKIASFIKNKALANNSMLQLGLIISGEALGYLCGVPMPLLTAFPFIVAPKLLQPLINYSYLTMPLGIMAYQINKDPAQYLRGNLLNFAAIGGLILVKKVLSAKMAAYKLVIENKLSIEDDHSDDSEEQPVFQANPEPKAEAVLFQHASRSKSKAKRKVGYVPLSYVFDNVSDDDSSEDSDYIHKNSSSSQPAEFAGFVTRQGTVRK